MENKTFLENYRICTNGDDSPHEVSRTGAAINYKAIDARSNEPVVLQLVPLASVDSAGLEQFKERALLAQKLDHLNIARLLAVGVQDEYIALVSEQVEGETVDSWIVAHGPMAVDAVFRVGIQVVRALAAAAFYSLTHRAIQPSNIMIVPGRMDDGGWPVVKLLSFGLAGLEAHCDSVQARELALSIAPQFASPEQLQNRTVDFRSEIYSLGATMCFLLTGAVPLTLDGIRSRFRARRLPELRHAPKELRSLLGYMLQENPERRPQDPILFEQEIRKCLTKIERRQAIRRKLGIPIAAAIPIAKRQESPPIATPAMQMLYGALVFLAILLTGAVVAAFLLPKGTIPFLRVSQGADKIGVPVGVPEPATTAPASPTSVPMIASTSPVPNQPALVGPTQPETNLSFAPAEPNTSSPAQIASTVTESHSESPAEAPDDNSMDQTKPGEKQDSETSDSASSSRDKAKAVMSNSNRTQRTPRAREADRFPNEYARSAPGRRRRGSIHARFLGTTADGRMILRLPSGHVVVVTPGAPDQELEAPRRGRLTKPPEIFVPRAEPVYPPDYPPYD